MNTLLVPLDGSALAEQSLPYVRTLAGLLGARVRQLRVITETPDDDLLAESIGSVYGMHEPLTIQRERQQHTFDMLRQNAERYLANIGYTQATYARPREYWLSFRRNF